jgi:hypothetical protein
MPCKEAYISFPVLLSLSADSLFALRRHRHNKESVAWSDSRLPVFFTISLTRGP